MGALKESGHYYHPNGKPAYTVAKANGKGRRKTTIADCRKLGLYPSVTTILSLLNKPALNSWREKLIVEHTDDTEREPGEAAERYIGRIFAKHKRITQSAADRGSRIHGLLESMTKGKPFLGIRSAGDELIERAVSDYLRELSGDDDWIAEESAVCHRPKYAGKVDLYHPGLGIVLDYKSKEFGSESADRVKGWPDQGMQLGAYAQGLGIREPRLINLFVSSSTPGLIVPYEHKDPERLVTGFNALAYYWWAMRGLDDPEEINAALRELDSEDEGPAED